MEFTVLAPWKHAICNMRQYAACVYACMGSGYEYVCMGKSVNAALCVHAVIFDILVNMTKCREYAWVCACACVYVSMCMCVCEYVCMWLVSMCFHLHGGSFFWIWRQCFQGARKWICCMNMQALCALSDGCLYVYVYVVALVPIVIVSIVRSSKMAQGFQEARKWICYMQYARH